MASNNSLVILSIAGLWLSILFRLNALATSERSRVCLGGSLSKIESA